MDSKALKRAYGMMPHQKGVMLFFNHALFHTTHLHYFCFSGCAGVLLRSLAAASDEANMLKEDDILLRIDGVEVRGI